MADDDDLKTFSFRAEKEKVDYLGSPGRPEERHAGAGIGGKISRSDSLRDYIDDLIEELEEDLEGNSEPRTVAEATSN